MTHSSICLTIPPMGEWKPVSAQEVGDMIEDQTNYKPDLFEAAVMAEAMGKEMIKHLKEGGIPCLAKVNEDGTEADVVPTMEKDQLKSLWRVFTNMTEEEMEEQIDKSGLYKVD